MSSPSDQQEHEHAHIMHVPYPEANVNGASIYADANLSGAKCFSCAIDPRDNG